MATIDLTNSRILIVDDGELTRFLALALMVQSKANDVIPEINQVSFERTRKPKKLKRKIDGTFKMRG